MRRPLSSAHPGQTLAQVLQRIGPPALATFLQDGPGTRLVPAGAPEMALERLPGEALRYRLPGTTVTATIAIEVAAELGTAVQRVTLTNDGEAPSPALRTLDALYLPLAVRVRHRPRACGLGGGSCDGFYPPHAFQVEEVCFGEAREWDPVDPPFGRWWTGKRCFNLSSVPDGRSSEKNLPILQLGWQTGETETGLWVGLEWTGRWELQVISERDGHFVLRGGPIVQGLILDPGETLRLPAVHVGTYAPDRDAGFNRIRRYLAGVVAPDLDGKRPHPPVAYNTWAGLEERISDPVLRRQVDRAAELGMEYFVIDAAWYGGASENFANGVGNWERVDEVKFPNGLEPLAEYVRAKGLGLGMWFEPERGRVGSDWVTQHPDWYWDIGNPVNRHLNLTKPVVQDYLISTLSGWIEKLGLRWLRWDYNHTPGAYWDRVDPTGKVQFAYVAGLYRVWDMLLARHPQLVIENCAGGGSRVDLGTLRRCHSLVISDHKEDAHIARLMLTGGARFLPGNYMKLSTYVGEHDADEAVGSLQLISRMAGSVMIGGDIAHWSARHARMVARYLAAYRTFRHLLMKDYYALAPYPRTVGDWDVAEFVDPAGGEAVVLAYRMRGEHAMRVVRPRGLDRQATYRVIDPVMNRTLRTMAGDELMERGIRLTLQPESALVRHLVR